MKPILKALAKISIGSIITLLMALLTNKVIATMVGPDGTGIFSSWAAFVNAAGLMGTCFGATAIVQGASSRQGMEKISYLRSVFFVICCMTALVIAVLNIFAGDITYILLKQRTAEAVMATRFLSLHIFFLVISTFAISLLTVEQKYGQLAMVGVVSGICNFSVSYLVAQSLLSADLGQAALWYVLTFFAGACAGIYFLYRNKLFTAFSLSPAWVRTAFITTFFRVASIHIYYSLLQQFYFIFLLRKAILMQQGIFELGIFSLVWNIQMSYVGIILSSFTSYYLPAFIRLQTHEEKRSFIGNMCKLVVYLSVPLCISLIVTKSFVITLFGSSLFTPGLDLMRWMIIGDYMKILAWVFGIVAIAFGDIRNAMLLETFWYILFSAGLLLYAQFADTEAFGYTFVFAYFFLLIANLLYVRWKIRFTVSASHILLMVIGLALICGASIHTWNDRAISIQKIIIWMTVCSAIGIATFRKYIYTVTLAIFKRTPIF